jgi:N6-adenosine-specific RNA methylase IME4
MANEKTDKIGEELMRLACRQKFATVLADPPWRFSNRTGKMAPEHRRLSRYKTMTLQEIMELPIAQLVKEPAHLYLWIPNALLAEGLRVMERWGFSYKTNLVWYKVRKDRGPDRRGVGFYFRNVTELILFGTRGTRARTLKPGRRQANLLMTRKREHSRKPDELYDIIEACSPGPYLELFARHPRRGWYQWGDEHNHRPTPSECRLLEEQVSERLMPQPLLPVGVVPQEHTHHRVE